MVHGSCLCEAIQFEIDGRISGIGMCHCSICRRASGGAHTAMVVTGSPGFRWLSGEDATTTFQRPSGMTLVFCATCGCPAPIRHENGKVVLVPVGLLAEDEGLKLAQHIYVGSCASWDVIGEEGERFDEAAPA